MPSSSRRKGCRELKGLVSSINYDAKNSREAKGKAKVQGGILWCINKCADFILECKRVARSGEKTSYQAHAKDLEARYHLPSRDKAGVDYKCNCSKSVEMSLCGLDVFRVQ